MQNINRHREIAKEKSAETLCYSRRMFALERLLWSMWLLVESAAMPVD